MNENKTNINWYPGHMARTKKELKENIKLVDIVYEVIDARMPISSKIIDIDYIVKEKPKILVVTKYDLCDKKETDSLLKKYADTGYNIVVCDLMKNIGIKQILDETKKISKKINDDRSKKGLKPRKIRALVVGAPNVGKSTLINRLVGRRATVVGNRPGVTQNLSWIRINDDVELLDSPGILWPKLENQEHAHNLAALSSIKEEIIDKEDIAKYIIDKLSCYYPDKLMKRYSLEKIDLDTIFSDIAEKRGVLKKGGITDYDKVYSIIIRDLKDGLFGNITFDR